MTFSPLTEGRTWPLGYYHRDGQKLRRWQRRKRKIDTFVVHHAAITTDAGLKRELMAPGRTLSCTYAMGKDARVHGVVAEEYKPNTTAHAIDHQAVTIEIVNQTGAPEWKISDKQFEQLARLIADVAGRHGFPIDAEHVRGHREFAATACPGPYLWPRMEQLRQRARELAGQPAPAKPKPKPKPAKAKRPTVGARVKLATPWVRYVYPNLRGRMRSNLPAGTYKIVGISPRNGGTLRLKGAGYDGWVHPSASAGLQ